MRLCHHPVRWQPASTYVAGRRFATYGLEELSDAFAAIACEELEEGAHAYYSDLAHELAAPH